MFSLPDTFLTSLSCPLPEDIAALKGAGEYALALSAIDRRLQGELPAMLRTRLETEAIFLRELPQDYTLTQEMVIDEIRRSVPSFTPDELQDYLLDGKLDFIYLNGVRMFHEDTCASLLKTQRALNARALQPYDEKKPQLEAVIRRVMVGNFAWHYRLRAVTRIEDAAFVSSARYRVHVPVAAAAMQQSPAQDVRCTLPVLHLDDENAPQRTLYTELCAPHNAEIVTEYSYTQRPRYIDPMDEGAARVLYPDARPVCEEDLCEQPPHICFTPYLRQLAQELRGNEIDPVRIARKYYDFITTRVLYAYQRPYRLIAGGAEYTAVNLRGDCGLQALLFITLCRISGIPARWQSGLYAAPGDVGSHDWAQFYSPRLGWLPVDCSFGGTGRRHGSELRWNFYFGNLEPWRMVANRSYYAPLAPAKHFSRSDPYDNQRGEIETDTQPVRAFHTRYEMIEHYETEE